MTKQMTMTMMTMMTTTKTTTKKGDVDVDEEGIGGPDRKTFQHTNIVKATVFVSMRKEKKSEKRIIGKMITTIMTMFIADIVLVTETMIATATVTMILTTAMILILTSHEEIGPAQCLITRSQDTMVMDNDVVMLIAPDPRFAIMRGGNVDNIKLNVSEENRRNEMFASCLLCWVSGCLEQTFRRH